MLFLWENRKGSRTFVSSAPAVRWIYDYPQSAYKGCLSNAVPRGLFQWCFMRQFNFWVFKTENDGLKRNGWEKTKYVYAPEISSRDLARQRSEITGFYLPPVSLHHLWFSSLQSMKDPSLHIQKFSSMILLVTLSLLDIRLWRPSVWFQLLTIWASNFTVGSQHFEAGFA